MSEIKKDSFDVYNDIVSQSSDDMDKVQINEKQEIDKQNFKINLDEYNKADDDVNTAGFLEKLMSDDNFKLDENSYFGDNGEKKLKTTVNAAGEITSKIIKKVEQTIVDISTPEPEETLPTFREELEIPTSVIRDEDKLDVKVSKYQKVSINDEGVGSLEFDKIVSGLDISSEEVIKAVEETKKEKLKREQEREKEAQAAKEALKAAKGEEADETSEENQLEAQASKVKVPDFSKTEEGKSSGKKKRKNLMENFRVLTGNKKEDSSILENEIEEDSEIGLFEDIDDENCEDVFDAVEKLDGKKAKFDNIFSFGEKSIKAIQTKAKKEQIKASLKSAKQIKKELSAEKLMLKKKLVGSLIFTVISAILLILLMVYQPESSLDVIFTNNARWYVLANLLLTVGICVYLKDIIKSALNSIKLFSPNINTSFMIIAFVVLLDEIIMLITGSLVESGSFVHTVCVAFAGTCCVFASLSRVRTALNSLKAITTGEKLISIHTIDNEVDLGVMTKGEDYSKVLFSAPCEIPKKYNALTESRPLRNKYYSYVLVLVILVSFIVGVSTVIASGNSLTFIASFVSCVCVGMPFMQKLVVAKTNERVNARINKDGAIVKGFTAMKNCGTCEAVCLDIGEIYEANVSQFKTIASTGISKTDAVVFAASMLKQSKSLVSNCFDETVAALKFDLPEVEDFEYIQAQGYKAKIAGLQTVLCNRKYLENLDFEGLPTLEEEKYYANNATVMYLVVSDRLVTTFLVKYRVKLASKDMIKEFAKTPLDLVLYSHEVCFDMVAVRKTLKLEASRVKIMSETSEQILHEYKANKTLRKSSGLIITASKNNVLALVTAAYNLYHGDKIAGHLYFFGSMFSLILVGASLIISPTMGFNPLTIIALQTAWASVSVLLGARKG